MGGWVDGGVIQRVSTHGRNKKNQAIQQQMNAATKDK